MALESNVRCSLRRDSNDINTPNDKVVCLLGEAGRPWGCFRGADGHERRRCRDGGRECSTKAHGGPQADVAEPVQQNFRFSNDLKSAVSKGKAARPAPVCSTTTLLDAGKG